MQKTLHVRLGTRYEIAVQRAFNRSRQLCGSALVVTLIMLLSGCSSFKKHWETALAQPVSTNTFLGPWEGSWLSGKNQHRGRLRCVLQKETGDTYIAHFHAIYWKVLRYSYSVPMTFEGAPNESTFRGEADLGWWAGGRYEYAGRVTPVHFHSTYRCKYDHGTFEMERPATRAAR